MLVLSAPFSSPSHVWLSQTVAESETELQISVFFLCTLYKASLPLGTAVVQIIINNNVCFAKSLNSIIIWLIISGKQVVWIGLIVSWLEKYFSDCRVCLFWHKRCSRRSHPQPTPRSKMRHCPYARAGCRQRGANSSQGKQVRGCYYHYPASLSPWKMDHGLDVWALSHSWKLGTPVTEHKNVVWLVSLFLPGSHRLSWQQLFGHLDADMEKAGRWQSLNFLFPRLKLHRSHQHSEWLEESLLWRFLI